MNQITTTPLRPPRGARVAGRRAAETATQWWSQLTIAAVAVGVYLWVIHSQKAPLATPALLVGLAALLFQRTPPRFPAPWWWCVAFVGWTVVVAAGSPVPPVALDGAWNLAKLAVILFLVANLSATREQARAFVVLWLGIYALYPVRGTLFNIFFGFGIQGRNAWNFIFANPNDLAALTLPILAMSIAILPTAKGWTRAASLAGVAILPVLIVATQSRGGILALGVLMATFVVDHWRSRRRPATPTRFTRAARERRQLALAAGVLLAVVGVVKFAPEGVWKRMRDIVTVSGTKALVEVDDSGSAVQRLEIWRVSWAITRDHPFTGIGASVYPLVHQQYAGGSRFDPTARGARDTHSLFLNVLAETGVIGLLLYLLMLGSVFRQLARLGASGEEGAWMARALRAGLVAFLAASVFATMGHVPFLYLYIGLICLLTAIYVPPVRPAPRSLRVG